MSNPLNILHVQGSFDMGGKEARIVRLMNIWGERARHTLLIGNPDMDGALAAVAKGVDVRKATDGPSISGRASPAKLMATARYMRGFDLVLSYNWGAMDAVMAHRLFSMAMPLPPLIHHEDGFNADEAAGLKLERNLYRRAALGSAYALVVPSSTLEHIAIRQWHLPCGKVHNIPNGIDVAAYAKPPNPGAIRGLEGADGRLVVGTVAGLRPVKNLARLVRVAAPLADRVRLVIVGDGPDRANILAEAAAHGVDPPLMPGFLPRPQNYVGLFEIFALTSDSEQFPIALVEAMAAGRPVVATDVGDIAAMLPVANRPFVRPPHDETGLTSALGQLAADATLRARLGAANRERAAAAFDEGGMVRRYAELYGGAVGSSALFAEPA